MASDNIYDEVYGMSLDEYCAVHNTTMELLIGKVAKDVEILKENFKKEYTGMLPTPLGDKIYEALEKKRKHLDRLKDWARA